MKLSTRACLTVLVLTTLNIYAKSVSAFSSPVLTKATPTVITSTNTQIPLTASATTNHIQRVIYDAKNGSSLPGIIVRKEGDTQTGDAVIDDVYDTIGELHDFFLDNYKRDSIDGKGMVIKTTVHFGIHTTASFWNGQQLVIGDGDKDVNGFTTDLIAKQYVLGITQYEAGLTPTSRGQPGALNQSFGDIFSSLFTQNRLHQTASTADWIIGKGVYKFNTSLGILSLKAPGTAYNDAILGKDPQPAHMKDYVNTVNDNYGVHINSGIPNHAFYVTAIEIGGYAWEKAGLIWYITLRDKLNSYSTFQDAANQTFKVAGELYGVGSLEQEAVRKGWSDVGIQVYSTYVATPIAPPPGDGCLSSLLGVVVFGVISFGTTQTRRQGKSNSVQ